MKIRDIKEYLFLFKSRLHAKRSLVLLWSWHLLRLKKLLRIDFTTAREDRSIKIDIVVPTVDFDTLAESLEARRKNILHTINKIFIVSKAGIGAEEFCQKNNCVFIDERSVLGYGKEAMPFYTVDNVDRRGWLFQQLLKLSGEKFVEMENYLIIDADTMLINPHSFIEAGTYVFFQNEEWNEPYFKNFKKIFGYPAPTRLSYTSHMMIFNTKKLALMKKEIEKKHRISWDKVYVSTTAEQEFSCISDYDTYANWVLHNFPHEVKNRVFYNKGLSRKYLAPIEILKNKWSKKYNSLSFHIWIQ